MGDKERYVIREYVEPDSAVGKALEVITGPTYRYKGEIVKEK
jgi:hypothetical protein